MHCVCVCVCCVDCDCFSRIRKRSKHFQCLTETDEFGSDFRWCCCCFCHCDDEPMTVVLLHSYIHAHSTHTLIHSLSLACDVFVFSLRILHWRVYVVRCTIMCANLKKKKHETNARILRRSERFCRQRFRTFER